MIGMCVMITGAVFCIGLFGGLCIREKRATVKPEPDEPDEIDRLLELAEIIPATIIRRNKQGWNRGIIIYIDKIKIAVEEKETSVCYDEALLYGLSEKQQNRARQIALSKIADDMCEITTAKLLEPRESTSLSSHSEYDDELYLEG